MKLSVTGILHDELARIIGSSLQSLEDKIEMVSQKVEGGMDLSLELSKLA